MAINGSRSVYPLELDDWGSLYTNNTCQIVTAERFNEIQDAVWKLEVHTRRTILAGKTGAATAPASGIGRPAIMFKAFTVTATGAASVTKQLVIPGPAFNSDEQDLFGGTPLASGNLIHVQVRNAAGETNAKKSYHGGISAIPALTGDSGFTVTASTLRHGNGDFTIAAGTYVVSLIITRH